MNVSSHIVNYLENKIAQDSARGAILYHYCEFAVSDTLDHHQIVRSLLRQLVESRVKLPQEVENLYFNSRGQPPKLSVLLETFRSIIIQASEPIYILIDGLDEFPDRHDLLDIIQDLNKDTSLIRVLLSSRPEYDLRQRLSTESSFSIEPHPIGSRYEGIY